MPKLWHATIEAHRRDVRDAILNATAVMVATHGLRAVTMSQIAEETGIGRATLYKYFSDVEAILVEWHQRQVNSHHQQLIDVRDQARVDGDRLEAVLTAYALMSHAHLGTELAALLHRGDHGNHAQQHLTDLIQELLAEGATAGTIRDDVPPNELTRFCLHAIAAASSLPSEAVRRLVMVILDGLRPRG